MRPCQYACFHVLEYVCECVDMHWLHAQYQATLYMKSPKCVCASFTPCLCTSKSGCVFCALAKCVCAYAMYESVASCTAQGLPVGIVGPSPPLKSAFYSVSHKQITAWSVHFQNHSITSSDLSSTSVDLHFFFFFLLPGGSCKATHLCEQCASSFIWLCKPFHIQVLHSHKNRNIQQPHINL